MWRLMGPRCRTAAPPWAEALPWGGHAGIAAWACNATCLSFLVALEAAAALLHRPDRRYAAILIASSEIASAGVDPFDLHTAALFGDGAAAVVLRRAAPGEGSCVQRALLQTFSEGARLTQIEGAGTRLPPHPRDETLDHRAANPEVGYRHHHFQMDGEPQPAARRAAAPRWPPPSAGPAWAP